MTEAEWMNCADPEPMLEFLRGKASDRKLRLFAVACCRRVWNLLSDERSRIAVTTAESFADGAAGLEDAGAAWNSAYAYADSLYFEQADGHFHSPLDGAAGAAGWCGAPDAYAAAHHSATDAAWAGDYGRGRERTVRPSERTSQSRLLRCIIGNPFRPVTPSPAWLAWKDGALRKMAAGIYAERGFADLPILADALEDAGCADAAVLAHCRSGGAHVHGCWVVDLLLGKQ
jgi:hypothetical protein